MEDKTRKKLIKKVAVIFLVALLILTFFSNTIMNYSFRRLRQSRLHRDCSGK